MSWIFKINQFFDFHQTPEEQRLRIASFYMEGEALTWFQWMHSNGQLLSWPMFLHALDLRFAPSLYDDPKGALFKLCQTTSVANYQTTFESLANRIVGLPPQFYLSCFISGLKPAIRREVQAFQPISLSHAISLAKLQEEKINDRPPFTQTRRSEQPTPPQRSPTNDPKPALTTVPASPAKAATPIKRLSPAELQARREKGLCYNCDEQFHIGHQCRRQFHLLIAEPDPSELDSKDWTHLLLDASTHTAADPDPAKRPTRPRLVSTH